MLLIQFLQTHRSALQNVLECILLALCKKYQGFFPQKWLQQENGVH